MKFLERFLKSFKKRKTLPKQKITVYEQLCCLRDEMLRHRKSIISFQEYLMRQCFDNNGEPKMESFNLDNKNKQDVPLITLINLKVLCIKKIDLFFGVDKNKKDYEGLMHNINEFKQENKELDVSVDVVDDKGIQLNVSYNKH